MVALDVTQGKVSAASARDDYGVVLVATDDGFFAPDLAATAALRRRLAAEREAQYAEQGARPFFDRGPGYRRLSGQPFAEVDILEESSARKSPSPS